MRNLYRTLLQLFTEGGLEIRTLSPGRTGDSTGGCPTLLAKTVIQADGDIILFLSEEALNQPALMRVHLKKMKEEINSFGSLRSILDHSKVWIGAASGLLAIHHTYFRNPTGLVAAVVIFVSTLCLMPLMMSLVRYRINRRLRRLIS